MDTTAALEIAKRYESLAVTMEIVERQN